MSRFKTQSGRPLIADRFNQHRANPLHAVVPREMLPVFLTQDELMMTAQLAGKARDAFGRPVRFVEKVPLLGIGRLLQKAQGAERIRLVRKPFPLFALSSLLGAIFPDRALDLRCRSMSAINAKLRPV